MKQSAYDRAKDAKAADADTGPPRHLMCAANGCPNRWSIDMGNGRLCRWHDGAPKERWPEITQLQQWDETERARLNAEPKVELPTRFPDPVRMRAIFRRYAQKVREREQQPKRWAHRLKAREEGGEKLGAVQREAWRAALGDGSAKAGADEGVNA